MQQAADDGADTKEYPCLVRATNGKEVKLSTRVRLLTLCSDHPSTSSLDRVGSAGKIPFCLWYTLKIFDVKSPEKRQET